MLSLLAVGSPSPYDGAARFVRHRTRSRRTGRLPRVPHQSAEEIVALLEAARVEGAPEGPFGQVSAEAYRRMSHDVLRQRHAQECAERPDASATYAHAGSHLHLWVRRGPGAAPWVALATSVGRPGQIAVNAGYRVFAADDEEAAVLAADPARALANLLVRHGVSYYSGTQRVYLLPEHVLSLEKPLDRHSALEFQRAVALEEPPEGAQVAVNVALSTTEVGDTRLAWFFVLDLTAYEREAAGHRR